MAQHEQSEAMPQRAAGHGSAYRPPAELGRTRLGDLRKS